MASSNRSQSRVAAYSSRPPQPWYRGRSSSHASTDDSQDESEAEPLQSEAPALAEPVHRLRFLLDFPPPLRRQALITYWHPTWSTPDQEISLHFQNRNEIAWSSQTNHGDKYSPVSPPDVGACNVLDFNPVAVGVTNPHPLMTLATYDNLKAAALGLLQILAGIALLVVATRHLAPSPALPEPVMSVEAYFASVTRLAPALAKLQVYYEGKEGQYWSVGDAIEAYYDEISSINLCSQYLSPEPSSVMDNAEDAYISNLEMAFSLRTQPLRIAYSFSLLEGRLPMTSDDSSNSGSGNLFGRGCNGTAWEVAQVLHEDTLHGLTIIEDILKSLGRVELALRSLPSDSPILDTFAAWTNSSSLDPYSYIEAAKDNARRHLDFLSLVVKPRLNDAHQIVSQSIAVLRGIVSDGRNFVQDLEGDTLACGPNRWAYQWSWLQTREDLIAMAEEIWMEFQKYELEISENVWRARDGSLTSELKMEDEDVF